MIDLGNIVAFVLLSFLIYRFGLGILMVLHIFLSTKKPGVCKNCLIEMVCHSMCHKIMKREKGLRKFAKVIDRLDYFKES